VRFGRGADYGRRGEDGTAVTPFTTEAKGAASSGCAPFALAVTRDHGRNFTWNYALGGKEDDFFCAEAI